MERGGGAAGLGRMSFNNPSPFDAVAAAPDELTCAHA